MEAAMSKKKVTDPAADPTSLGNLVMQAGVCTPMQLRAALAEKADEEDQLLGEILVRMGILTEKLLHRFLDQQQVLRSSNGNVRHALRSVSVAASATLALSGSLNELNDLALLALQKLKP
jgi:hypothetical protein